MSQGNFATFSPSFPSLSAANLVIAIGTVVMVTGFLGCLGAIKENKCLLLSVSWTPHPQPSELSGSPCVWATMTGKAWEHQLTEPREIASRMFFAQSLPSSSRLAIPDLIVPLLMSFPCLSGFPQK